MGALCGGVELGGLVGVQATVLGTGDATGMATVAGASIVGADVGPAWGSQATSNASINAAIASVDMRKSGIVMVIPPNYNPDTPARSITLASVTNWRESRTFVIRFALAL